MSWDVAQAIQQALVEARVARFADGGDLPLSRVAMVQCGFDLFRQLQRARPDQLGAGWAPDIHGGDPRVLGAVVAASPAVEPWGWQVWVCTATGRGQALR